LEAYGDEYCEGGVDDRGLLVVGDEAAELVCLPDMAEKLRGGGR